MHFDKKGNNPALAVSYFVKGLKLLGSKGLRQFLWIPVLINFLLYGIVFVWCYYYLGALIDQMIPTWLHWLRWLLLPLFFTSFFIMAFFTFTLLANLLAAPFYGRLAAKTMSVINGQQSTILEPPVLKVLLAECNRAGYFAIRALPLLIISIIPGLNLIAPVLWALFGAWGMALEYMAYPMENAGILFKDQKRLLGNVRLGALSFGGVAALGLTVPFLNIFVAPAAVIGATIYFYDIKTEA
jgi:CysZ protein